MKRYIQRIKKYIFLQIVFAAIGTGFSAAAPLLEKWVFDKGVSASFRQVILVVSLYFLLQVLGALMEYFAMLASFGGAVNFEKFLKRDFLRAVLQRDYQTFHERPTGEYLSMISNDIEALEMDYLQPIIAMIRGINQFVIYGAILFVGIDSRLAVVTILASVLSLLGSRLPDSPMMKKRAVYQNSLSEYTAQATSFLDGFSAIDRQTLPGIQKAHEEALENVRKNRMNYGRMKSVSISVSLLSTNLLNFTVFAFIVYFFVKGTLSVGEAVATLSFLGAFISPLYDLLDSFSQIRSMKEIKERFVSFLSDTAESKAEKKQFENSLELIHAGYRMGEKEFREISLKITKGSKVAVIGSNGSGKSTLLKAMAGYLPLLEGEVTMDGMSLEKIDVSRLLTYVDQTPPIFLTDIEANVSMYGSLSLSRVRETVAKPMLSFLKELFCREDIRDAHSLSGGEKQMISFLRTVAGNAEIILLDEPFSAVDVKKRERLEDEIFHSSLWKDKTVIMVTHFTDQESLSRFDEVYRVKDGTVRLESRR